MALDPELQALLTLHLVPGLGPRLTAALLKRFNSAQAIIRAPSEELRQVPHLGELAHKLHQAFCEADVPGELDLIAQHQVRLLALGTPEYPSKLGEIYDPPHLLYLIGSLLPGDSNAVAVVGSRQCSSYGQRVAERL